MCKIRRDNNHDNAKRAEQRVKFRKSPVLLHVKHVVSIHSVLM